MRTTGAWRRRVLGAIGLALTLALLAPPSAADPWQVRRDPAATRRRDVVSTLIAAPDSPALAERLRARLSPAELERALTALRERATGSPPRYAPVMAHAQLLLASGQEAAALAELERAAAMRPERLGPLRGTALALSRLGRRDEAADLLDAAAARPGTDRSVRAELLVEATELGEAAETEAVTDRRLRQGLDALLAWPAAASGRRWQLLDRLGQVALRRGLGSSFADRLAEHAPRLAATQRRAILRQEAELREALGDHPRALQVWESIVRLGGGQGDRLDGPGARVLVLLDRLGRRTELEAAVARLARAGARNEGALLDAVERAYQRGDKELGARLFDHAHRGLGRSPDGLARLADLASRFNDPSRVLATWQAVLLLDPRDERAIVALGEAHFQGGRRELARDTWRRLERVIRPPAAGHARLAELFGDHDMLPEAVAEARKAQRLERDNLHHHRTLARILERKRDNPGAISEWRAVLAGGTAHPRAASSTRQRRNGDDQALRKEARQRLVGLLAREGRERLRAETVLLKDRARRHPDDRESALYLAELQLRLGQPGEAVETLTATAEARPRDSEVVLFLVQLLRQSKQTIRALDRLERFVEVAPERAPETLLRIAGLRAERYEDEAALAALARAVALGKNDPELLVRSAELAESLGETAVATEHYRAALAARPGVARAAAGLARLRSLVGDARGAAEVLMVPPLQPEVRERLLPLSFYAGSPGELLALAEPGPGPDGPRPERPLVEATVTEVRALYQRAPAAPEAARRLAALARTVGRPLYDLLLEANQDPPSALAAIEALGMLGNDDAVPSLIRILELPSDPASSDELRTAAAVALGRLADERATPALVGLIRTGTPELRAAGAWALGRLQGARASEALAGAASDPRSEVAALALLGLGRQRQLSSTEVLQTLADHRAGPLVQRAALVAAARAGLEGLDARLTELLAASEPRLAACAATALLVLGAERSVALWRQALLGAPLTRRQAARVLEASGAPEPHAGPPLEDARLLRSGPPDVPALLDGLCRDPSPGLRRYRWAEDAKPVGEVLGEALAEGGQAARAALRAVDELATASDAPAGALRQLASRLRLPLQSRLRDRDIAIRLGAIRVAARLPGADLDEAQVVAALEAVAPERRSAVAPLDPEAIAVLAAEALRVRGRLHAESLRTRVYHLLAHPAWQTRRATVRVLTTAGALSPQVAARARADASPFVRQAAQQAAQAD